MLKDAEYCPKCRTPRVYSHHEGETWMIKCVCGFGTKKHPKYKYARSEWEMKKELIKNG